MHIDYEFALEIACLEKLSLRREQRCLAFSLKCIKIRLIHLKMEKLRKNLLLTWQGLRRTKTLLYHIARDSLTNSTEKNEPNLEI